MKVRFWHSDKPRERILCEAFLDGARAHGDEVDKRALGSEFTEDCEVAVMVGVKSRELWRRHVQAGINTVYLDKGYSRHSRSDDVSGWEYWRAAVNAHQPTGKYRTDFPDDRAKTFGWSFKPWRTEGRHILIAGSSEKYHAFYGLKDPTDWCRKLVKEIRGITDRVIIYRPKPSWKNAVPIVGTGFSDGTQSIMDVLDGAFCLVTHGSNACFEAVVNGIPCIVLGDAVARPISSTEVSAIKKPRLASDTERQQWLNFLAYHQWTLKEFSTGEAWRTIRQEIYA